MRGDEPPDSDGARLADDAGNRWRLVIDERKIVATASRGGVGLVAVHARAPQPADLVKPSGVT
jgi:hypothetical protein